MLERERIVEDLGCAHEHCFEPQSRGLEAPLTIRQRRSSFRAFHPGRQGGARHGEDAEQSETGLHILGGNLVVEKWSGGGGARGEIVYVGSKEKGFAGWGKEGDGVEMLFFRFVYNRNRKECKRSRLGKFKTPHPVNLKTPLLHTDAFLRSWRRTRNPLSFLQPALRFQQ